MLADTLLADLLEPDLLESDNCCISMPGVLTYDVQR